MNKNRNKFVKIKLGKRAVFNGMITVKKLENIHKTCLDILLTSEETLIFISVS